MPKTMLIDTYHPEETRVAVLQGGKVEDFDFEYASRKPLRGNIYLARVTRVEPSLQAAFIEYGGNRHGFLAFGEIHPDYYQIPVADREVLRKAEALEVELAKKLADLSQDDDDFDPDEDELRSGADDDEAAEAAAAHQDDGEDTGDGQDQQVPPDFVQGGEDDDAAWHGADEDLIASTGAAGADEDDAAEDNDSREEEEEEEEASERLDESGDRASEDSGEASEAEADEEETDLVRFYYPGGEAKTTSRRSSKGKPEETKGNPADREIQELRKRYEEAKRERNRLIRAYKIQEVIKRRQIMLVQVVKEERGNKGAALTTYLSLAGRYGVLMPNTARGGGISRKITSQGDRKRLKKAVAELDIAPNMGLIIRTAGAKRTKTEIKRDYDYLSRLWETIREKTLESVAPALIYEEASLIRRAIRDLYDKDTEMVHVQGEQGYREAKDFMKMLMPSHAKFVQQHKSDVPIFMKHKVDEQLDQMYQPVVQLKSGGYLVIQQTEALVSIDVNSGKSTKERNVEQTALKTNSEAAVEVARQCRLRDLAGLIVIDFIDMEENRNNRAVEKKLKDAMKNDRARTQIGSISNFGLLELSRQRRRSGIVDGTTQACPVCQGAGHVRSHEMAALRILRACEGESGRGKHGLITVKTSVEVALYVLNTKRDWLQRIEGLYGVKTNIIADSSKFGDQYEVTGSGTPSESISLKDTIGDDGPLADLDAPELPGVDAPEDKAPSDDDEDDKPKRRRRRRRRKKSGDDTDAQDQSDDQSRKEISESEDQSSDEDKDSDEDDGSDDTDSSADGEPKRRRRRGRRGGRRNRRSRDDRSEDNAVDGDEKAEASSDEGDQSQEQKVTSPEEDADKPDPANDDGSAAQEQPPEEEAAKDGDRVVTLETKQPEPISEAEPEHQQASSPAEPENNDRGEPKPRRSGWWQRAFQKN